MYLYFLVINHIPPKGRVAHFFHLFIFLHSTSKYHRNLLSLICLYHGSLILLGAFCTTSVCRCLKCWLLIVGPSFSLPLCLSTSLTTTSVASKFNVWHRFYCLISISLYFYPFVFASETSYF